ncbi:peptidase S8/S53 domain-containing protein [Aspergillus pseudonomiae]|nr:peptidase S8/S53 domain-containing protein [Aspergillus pseudonomiae]
MADSDGIAEAIAVLPQIPRYEGLEVWDSTGINYPHLTFEGRVRPGFVAVPEPDLDKYGYGIYVAGTIGSRVYGVAKRTQLISTRAFLVESGMQALYLDHPAGPRLGYQRHHYQEAPDCQRIDMSNAFSENFNALVAAPDALGMTTVVAAGNEGVPAVTTSPVSSPHAITIGAIAAGNVEASSKWVIALDVFAPGVDAQSAYIGSPVVMTTKSGMSMASPHICGLTVELKLLDFLSDGKTVAARIDALATKSVVIGDGPGSPNKLALNRGVTLGPIVSLNAARI